MTGPDGPPNDLDELALAPLVTQLDALASGAVTSRDLLECLADRIDRLDGELGAVVTLDLDGARDRADRIDRARAAGADVGPLQGVPVTVKDALATEGIRSTGGATELADHVPSRDATVVARVRAAGAVVFAKTNLPRWSGDVQSYNDLFGATANPWDLTRSPGGSSGGAATAVAMGFTGFEIGTDLGGSIRVPSAWCGVWGHKPSHGLVPTDGYLDAPDTVDPDRATELDINVFGPLARSADDLQLLLDLLAGPGPERGPAWRLELPPPRTRELGELRIGLWLDDPFCPVDPEVGEILTTLADRLADAGARLDPAARPDLDPGHALGVGLGLVGAATTVGVPDAVADRLAAEGRALTHRDWLGLTRERAALATRWAELFSQIDVLVCPVTPVAPIVHDQAGDIGTRRVRGSTGDERPYVDLIGWTVLTGNVGLPATVVPAGRTEGGLPVGVQVVGPRWGDLTTLSAAAAIGEAVGGTATAGYDPPPRARG